MEIKNAPALGAGSNGHAPSFSWCEPHRYDQAPQLVVSLLGRTLAALISLLGMLFEKLVHFHLLAAELPPEHRTWFGSEDVDRVAQLLLRNREAL